jgi:hypothetical protein
MQPSTMGQNTTLLSCLEGYLSRRARLCPFSAPSDASFDKRSGGALGCRATAARTAESVGRNFSSPTSLFGK